MFEPNWESQIHRAKAAQSGNASLHHIGSNLDIIWDSRNHNVYLYMVGADLAEPGVPAPGSAIHRRFGRPVEMH